MDDSKNSFNQIKLAQERSQTAVVVELCGKHLQKFPNDWAAWLYYATAQTELFRYTAAEKAIRRAMALCPQNNLRFSCWRMGDIFQAKGNFKQAAFWYRKAIKEKPQEATYHNFLGNNAFKQGALKQAEKYLRRAILQCSEGCLEETYFNLGGILLGKRKYAEAIKCYEETLKINPKYKIAKERLDDAKLASLIAEAK